MKDFGYHITLVLGLMSLMMLASCNDNSVDSNVNSLKFNDSWLYIRPDSSNQADVESALRAGESVAGCLRISLPSPQDSSFSYNGNSSYYYRHFILPSYMSGKRISLFFDALPRRVSIWFNGDSIAVPYNNDFPVILDVKPVAGDNSVVVRIDGDESLYSGVWLCAQDSLSFTHAAESIEDCGISVDANVLPDGDGMLGFEACVRNSYSENKSLRLEYHIYDHNRVLLAKGHLRNKVEAGSFKVLKDSIMMSDITLWDICNPWIYTVDFSLMLDGNVVDRMSVDFGFRDISVSQGSVDINGNSYFLMGVNAIHSYPYVGRALSREAHWRDAWRIKRAGFDFVNVSSTNHPDEFLNACDHYGIIVLDTCDDNRSRVRRNHPCILHLPDSRGVRNYGKGMVCNIDSPESDLQNQAIGLSNNHNSNRMSHYFADAVSNMFDINCNHSGVMTACRIPKFSYYFYQAQRDIDYDELEAFAEPFCNVLSDWIPGKTNCVWVCSNCAYVELLVDGVSVGKKKVNTDDPSNFLKHPPVRFDVQCQKPGSITAIGYSDNDNALAESVVMSSGNPVRIKLVIDESGTLISDNDIVLVHCYIVDNNGNTVKCDSEVEFGVRGTAQLLSPVRVRAVAGIATCVIRTGKSSNDFTISAKCGQMYTVIDK